MHIPYSQKMAITTSSLNFIFPLLFVLLSTHSSATSISKTDSFIECLINHLVDSSFPINEVIYTPINSSFPSVLQSYIRNIRFNTSTTPKPTLIITALHASHIQAAVVCGRAHNLLLRTRSGGHDYEGLSYSSITNQPFFIIDMFNLRSININIEEETAWVETGATLGELYYRIAEKSNTHAFPAGVCSTVGVGGHVSAGGQGYLMRKYGLSVDNIVDAQLIDVNGRLLDRESMGEDLFWAITGGGGGSFGVVLAYKLKLVRVPSVVTMFKIERISSEKQKASTIAQKWVQVADKLDNDVFIAMHLEVNKDNNGEKTISVVFLSVFLGNATTLVELLNKDFPELGLEKSECVEMSWVESMVFFNDHPIGTPTSVLLNREIQYSTQQFKIKSDYVKTPISEEDFEFIFEKLKEFELCAMSFCPYGGRMNEISELSKPFAHRSGYIATIEYKICWDEAGVEAANRYIHFIRKMYDYMAPFVSKNPREVYLNYRDLDIGVNSHGKNAYFEGKVYGLKYFKETNYKRLTMVKGKVDPSNFFRNEQSIPVRLSRPPKTKGMFGSSIFTESKGIDM